MSHQNKIVNAKTQENERSFQKKPTGNKDVGIIE